MVIFTSQTKRELLDDIKNDPNEFTLDNNSITYDEKKEYNEVYKGKKLIVKFHKYEMVCLDVCDANKNDDYINSEKIIYWQKFIKVDEDFIDKYKNHCFCVLCSYTPQTLNEYLRFKMLYIQQSFFSCQYCNWMGCILKIIPHMDKDYKNFFPASTVYKIIDRKENGINNFETIRVRKKYEKQILRIVFLFLFSVLVLMLAYFFRFFF